MAATLAAMGGGIFCLFVLIFLVFPQNLEFFLSFFNRKQQQHIAPASGSQDLFSWTTSSPCLN